MATEIRFFPKIGVGAMFNIFGIASEKPRIDSIFGWLEVKFI